MEILKNLVSTLYDSLTTELDIINKGSKDILTLAAMCIKTIRQTLVILKNNVLENGFESEAAEILFFKTMKPKFYSLLIYYSKVYSLELNRPIGSKNLAIEYLRREEDKLYFFYEENREFYQYYRANSNHLDDMYFIRKNTNAINPIVLYHFDTDDNFTTSQDFTVSSIMANELVKEYIEEAILQFSKDKNTPVSKEVSTDLVWTASKASLVELLYGLQSIGVFNNGNVELQQLATVFEMYFNVKLGNYYRGFQEIRIRKNRTQFLDEVKKKLTEKMDYWDENPKSK